MCVAMFYLNADLFEDTKVAPKQKERHTIGQNKMDKKTIISLMQYRKQGFFRFRHIKTNDYFL